MAIGDMDAKAILRPEVASVFEWLDSLGLRQRDLAQAIGIAAVRELLAERFYVR